MNNTAVYDTGSDRLIIFGGFTTDTPCCAGNDVWILTNASRKGGARQWIKLPIDPSSELPPPTAAASAVYDPISNEMIVYGGQAYGASSSDVWVLHHANGLGGPASWSYLPMHGGTPPPRQNHQAVYSPKLDNMIVVGGLENTGSLQLLNDVWVLAGAARGTPRWEQVQVNGTSPSPRHSLAAFYDSSYGSGAGGLFIYGGCTDSSWVCSQSSHELWVLSGVLGDAPAWKLISSFGDPASRPTAAAQFAVAGFDAADSRLFVFGGRIVGQGGPFGLFTNETWMLSGTNSASPQWTQIKIGGNVPAPRGQSVSPDLYDPATARLIVFGGPGLNDTNTLLTH